jgi:hypothetical protein
MPTAPKTPPLRAIDPRCSLQRMAGLHIPRQGKHIACRVHGQHFIQGPRVA